MSPKVSRILKSAAASAILGESSPSVRFVGTHKQQKAMTEAVLSCRRYLQIMLSESSTSNQVAESLKKKSEALETLRRETGLVLGA